MLALSLSLSLSSSPSLSQPASVMATVRVSMVQYVRSVGTTHKVLTAESVPMVTLATPEEAAPALVSQVT